MNITVDNQKLTGSVRVIESKSFAHRIMLAAALAEAAGEKKTEIFMENASEDVAATRRVIAAMGEKKEVVDCGESGTTLRFAVPICAALGLRDRTVFTGQGRLMERPMGPLIEAMKPHGASVCYEEGKLVLKGRLTAGKYTIAANVSSQYISGLLFALPLLQGDSSLQLVGQVESRPYIDITLKVLEKFGICIEEDRDQNLFLIKGGQRYQSLGRIQVEGDWSNGAFWLAAGAVGGGPVTVTGLNLKSVQGDRAILEVLRRFGAEVTETARDGETDSEMNSETEGAVTVSETDSETEGAVTVSCAGKMLKGIELDVKDIPDLVPIISVVAAAAQGDTRLYNAGRLRIKESDRLVSTTAMLKALGAAVEEGEDYLLIHGSGKDLLSGCQVKETGVGSAPGLLSGGQVDGARDHRIVMSAAVAAAVCSQPVTICGAEAVNKSYPGFFEKREMLTWEAAMERI